MLSQKIETRQRQANARAEQRRYKYDSVAATFAQCGYNVQQTAERLGVRPQEVRKAIADPVGQNRLAIIQQAADDSALVNSKWLLAHLSDILKADVADIIEEATGRYKPIHKWPVIWRQMMTGVDIKEEFAGSRSEREQVAEVTKIKFLDRIKAIELAGKHVLVNAFSENVNVHAKVIMQVSTGIPRPPKSAELPGERLSSSNLLPHEKT